MKAVIILSLLLAGCAQTMAEYNPAKPKTDLPDLPSVRGAGKTTPIPKKKMTDEEKDALIVQMRKSEKANAEGYNARGRAYDRIKRIYSGQ